MTNAVVKICERLVFFILVFGCFSSAVCAAFQDDSLRVTVTDQTGALIPGVTVRLKNGKELIKEIVNSDDETVSFSKLPLGKYVLEVEVQGFKPFSQEIQINPGKNEFTVKLEIAEIVENVRVERDRQDKALDSGDGAFTNFLTREQIEALPDDPEELEQALKNQFGQDVVIRVDGFTGRMPPKSQIASIRVTRSSFDAEYHQLGVTFIDIISKAGGGIWGGSVSFNFNDESLNARNPFAVRRFPIQQRRFDAVILGPIAKGKTSLFAILSGENSYRQQNILAIMPNGERFNGSILNSLYSLYPFIKISHNLKDKSLNLSYTGSINNYSNQGVGGFNLPERAFSSDASSHQFRVAESGYIGKRFLNEIRFQFTDEALKTTPASDKATILVLDSFNAGGAGNRSQSRRQNIWLSDNLLFGLGKIHALKIGGLFEFERRGTESAANENGTFTFSSLDDYLANRPSVFTQRTGTRRINLSQVQIGAFVQDDVRLHRSFMLSLGVRYEWQNNLKDFSNFSPRVGFTWSPYKNGKMTFRGGAGIYYNWLETNNLATILSRSILQAGETVIINPGFPNPFQSGTSRILPPGYWQKAENLKNPYIFLASIGMERQLNKNASLRVLYKFQKGVYQFRSRDTNAPIDFIRPNPDFGRIVQVESSGFFAQNSLNVELNGRLTKTLSFAANYTLAKIVSDNDGIFSLPSDNYDLRLDRSVSSFDQRHRLYASAYWRIRKDLRFSTIFSAASPLPYTITTGFDNNGDTIFNDRPFGVERNGERGAWQRQVDMSLGWTIGLFSRKDDQTGKPGMIVVTSDEAASGDFGIDTKHKYSLKFSVTARNVFNQTNFTGYAGVQTSPFFGTPIAADNPRRIEFGMRFSF